MWAREHDVINVLPEPTKDAIRALKILSNLLVFASRGDCNLYLPTSYDIKNTLMYALHEKPEEIEPDRGQLLSRYQDKPAILPKQISERVKPRANLPDCEECRLLDVIRIIVNIMTHMDYLTSERINLPFFRTTGCIFNRLISWHHVYYRFMKMMIYYDRIVPCSVHGMPHKEQYDTVNKLVD